MNIDAKLTMKCDGCGCEMDIPFRWRGGNCVPCPSQIRVAILEYVPEQKELLEMETTPDLGVLALCDNCRREMVAAMVATLLQLRANRPLEKQTSEAVVLM